MTEDQVGGTPQSNTPQYRDNEIKVAVMQTQIATIEKRLARIEMLVWGVAVACVGVLSQLIMKGVGLK